MTWSRCKQQRIRRRSFSNIAHLLKTIMDNYSIKVSRNNEGYKHAKLSINRLSTKVYFSVMWAKTPFICLLYPENCLKTEPNLRRHGKTCRTESEGLTANPRHLVSSPFGLSHLVPPLLYRTGRKGHRNILTVVILCKNFTYFEKCK